MNIQHFAQQQFNKRFCLVTIKRLFLRGNLIWKRLRKFLKGSRDEELFPYFKIELTALQQQAKASEMDLCYFNETGLNPNSNVPCAWQEKGISSIICSKN